MAIHSSTLAWKIPWMEESDQLHSMESQRVGRSNPTSKEWWLHGHRKAERSYSMFKVRRAGREEILLIPGKEQQLHFAGAAMKRYPTSTARETQVRQ